MSWDEKQKEEAHWDSDERYVRKDAYSQETYSQNAYSQNAGVNSQDPFWSYQNVQAQYQPVGTAPKTDEYKRNNRVFIRCLLICAVIMVVGILFTAVSGILTGQLMERKIRQLNYREYTYEAGETLRINQCEVRVSDAFVIYDSSEVWMPSGQKLIGVYLEAVPVDSEYHPDAGISDPYLGYEEHYVSPVTDKKVKDVLLKDGWTEEQFLAVYSVGGYEKEAGYYCFLVDEDAEEFVFVIDERKRTTGKVEYLEGRHRIEIGLEEKGEVYE